MEGVREKGRRYEIMLEIIGVECGEGHIYGVQNMKIREIEI